MSIQTEINRIKQNINNALDSVASYGVQIESTDTSNELATRIAQIANALDGFIKYTQQTLTEAQKAQARANIGAASKSDIPIIPTNISAFNNDAGYLTQHQDISGKQDIITDLATIRRGAALGATALQSYTETDPTVPQYIKDATNIDDLANRVSYKGTKLALIATGVESIIEIDNPEWKEVVTDNENKILIGINQDGSYHIVKI